MTRMDRALRKLEKIGGEHERAARELAEAVDLLARKIVDQFHVRDERILDVNWKGRLMRYSIQNGRLVNSDSRWVGENRETVLAFASDIKAGLMDAVAEALVRRQAETQEALEAIEIALESS